MNNGFSYDLCISNTYFFPCRQKRIKDPHSSLVTGRTDADIISYEPQSVRGLLLQHIVSSEKYWGHDIVGKLAHRKFHPSFAAVLTTWLLLSLTLRLSVQKVGDHRGTVSLDRVSNSAARLVSQTGTFLSSDIPHMCTNVQPSVHTTDNVPRLWTGGLHVIRCHFQPSRLIFPKTRTNLSVKPDWWQLSWCSFFQES